MVTSLVRRTIWPRSFFESGIYERLATAERDFEVKAVFSKAPIPEVTPSGALGFADLMIHTTEELMENKPSRFSVGGPVDAVLLGVDAKPRVLRMKPI